MSFINDSGVIIDDSVSPARRWLKENLLIEQYAQVIRLTGIADDTRQRIEYEYIDESAAIAEYDILYGYLEDYGGGGSVLEIEQDGVSVDANVTKINVSGAQTEQITSGEVALRVPSNPLYLFYNY